MNILSIFFPAIFSLILSIPQVSDGSTGPYTVTTIGKDIYHIEDSNASNPAGETNNCSDMYLIVGTRKALLIDLSNWIRWSDDAVESLRRIVYDRVGKKELTIAITHSHGDHCGMLPAFAKDKNVKFWLPKADNFSRMDFPPKRTIMFDEGASINLGGRYIIKSFLLPGHTPGSTIYFLEGQNMVFTGDAIGSGGGLWIFSTEGFESFLEGFASFVDYIFDKRNGIDADALIIYGGHFWQKQKVNLENLGIQYIQDMYQLLVMMGEGTAESSPVSFPNVSYLDTNFKYGTAVITWNKEDAAQYSAHIRAELGL